MPTSTLRMIGIIGSWSGEVWRIGALLQGLKCRSAAACDSKCAKNNLYRICSAAVKAAEELGLLELKLVGPEASAIVLTVREEAHKSYEDQDESCEKFNPLGNVFEL